MTYPYDDLDLPPNVVDALLNALQVAHLTVQPLFLYPYDPLPQELMARFGLSYEALTAYTHHNSESCLRLALVDEVPTYTYYALVGQQVVQTPVLAAPLRALREELQPGADDWDTYAAMLVQSLEVLVLISSHVAARFDAELAESTLLVQRGEISGLFARLEHTLRVPSHPFEFPPTAATTPIVWQLRAGEVEAAGLAVRLPLALMELAVRPFAEALRQLPRLLLPALQLQNRLAEMPDDEAAALACIPDELLVLWQGTEVSLMAMYAPVTPCGTWEDWLLYGPLGPNETPSPLRQKAPETVSEEHARLCGHLQELGRRLRAHLAATHPDWIAAEAEVAALRATL